MLVTATSEVIRIMGVWVRRADAGLARGAADNAARSLADGRQSRADDVRALRGLHPRPLPHAAGRPGAPLSRRAAG
jgi:hypothetical protein